MSWALHGLHRASLICTPCWHICRRQSPSCIDIGGTKACVVDRHELWRDYTNDPHIRSRSALQCHWDARLGRSDRRVLTRLTPDPEDVYHFTGRAHLP